MSSLFEESLRPQDMPLAARLVPKDFSQFVGQEHILGEGKLLRRAIMADRVGSVIFYGPSGSGKTAAAKLISYKTKAYFIEVNAVTIGVSEIRDIVKVAKSKLATTKRRTILLLDEIHHFNRTQQDALLPDVEKGIITLIGITTENPFFYINSALLSRINIFEFKKLNSDALEKILEFALKDEENGYGLKVVEIEDDAKSHLIKNSVGDARRLLNALELAVESTPPSADGRIHIDLKIAVEAIQKRPIVYDKSSDAHYDHISAFIKSMRGSDPDAAIYWMSKMLSAGEDPLFIARRVVICAAEDVGMADPDALSVAISALHAVEFVGLPEARIPLTEAVIYVATAPKSNAVYLAMKSAQSEVETGPVRDVPLHLRDSTLDSSRLGHGKGYKYPHDYPDGFVAQEYMPLPRRFYIPKDVGYEKEIKKRIEYWQNLRRKSEDTK